jgi:hypothetical protein
MPTISQPNKLTAEPIHIISLGAGVQSSTMALMAAKGEITPMPAAAIFADVGDEPQSVYDWLDYMDAVLPFKIFRVTAGRDKLSDSALQDRVTKDGRKYFKGHIPATILAPDGTKGMAWRTCTMDFKIAPLRKQAKRMMLDLGKSSVVQWIGISLDEAHRMKPSRDKWCEMRWPLVDLGMKRHDCLLWMEKNGYPKPPRSACVFCPFHSDAEWRRLKTQEPSEFQKAVDFEKRMFKAADRSENLRGRPFLHGSCKPLDTVDFSTEEERGQINMFGNECTGLCGV